MASGMGIPSISIYAHELYKVYGVENIIRIGTAGGISPDLKVRSVVAAIGASTNSEFMNVQFPVRGHFAATATYRLLETAVGVAREQGIDMQVGDFYSTDLFYDASGAALEWGKLGCLVVEMETVALYAIAHQFGKSALSICTVSDNIVTGEEVAPEERETTFTEMMEIALETAIRL
jgi:purine-nucleoside phosphorylase